MKPKKSEKADLEWRKPTFFKVGLVVALAIVFMAFEYVGTNEKGVWIPRDGEIEIDGDIVISIPQPPSVPQPPQPQMAPSIMDIVKDDIPTDDLIVDAGTNQPTGDVIYDVIDTKEDDKPDVDVLFIVVEKMPKYPGGEEALYKFLSENINYPKVAIEIGLEGRVVIGFVVEPDGRLSNFEVVRSTSPVLDNEALRAAKLMPKWEPGKQRDKAVRVQYQIPVIFNLK